MTSPIVYDRRGKPKARLTWRERLDAFRYVPGLLRLVWDTHRGYTVITGVLRLVRSVFPVASLWIAKLIIDAVVGARDHGPDWPHLFGLVALEIAIAVVGDAMGRASQLTESRLGDLFA